MCGHEHRRPAASCIKRIGRPLPNCISPKLVTVLREGYGVADFRADVISGLTVAIVALPLSMAIAIASGVTPDRGLYTAVIGGFIVSLLGGSRFQIGGPAGAFIVLVALTVERHGVDGVILATADGRRVPDRRGPAAARHLHQVHSLSGDGGIHRRHRRHHLREPAQGSARHHACRARSRANSFRNWRRWRAALPTANPSAVAVAAVSIAIIVVLRRWRPNWPGILIAVVARGACDLGAGAAGGNHRHPLRRHSPAIAVAGVAGVLAGEGAAVLPDAIAFALLGAIESLLSAVVADGMTGRRHRSNCELVAQGFANIGSALFGGICVTGTIARTATNVRAGARGPGLRHAAFAVPAAVHADRSAAGELHPARGAGRRAGGGGLEHGGEARVRDLCSAPRGAMPSCCSPPSC